MTLDELNKLYGAKFNEKEFKEAIEKGNHPTKEFNDDQLKEYVWHLDSIWGHYCNENITRSKARELSIKLLGKLKDENRPR